MTVRNATAADLPSIQEIINYYRRYTTHLWDRTPLNPEQMTEWLSRREFPYAAIVAEQEGTVLGFASLSRFRPYAGYSPTAENSIYLAPGHTGNSHGSALMKELLLRAGHNGFKVVTAWIDSRNIQSVAFHEKFGFYHAGILKNVGTLDGAPASVIIMQYDVC